MVGTHQDGATPFYVPFQYPSYVHDDAPHSSDDGSGLHSPTFPMDSDPSIDGHRHPFRPPPSELDIHSVEGLIANRFPTAHPDAQPALSPYSSLPYTHTPNDLQYSNYHYGAHPHNIYEDDRRYLPREDERLMPSQVYTSNRLPSNKSLEMPRALTIPSLLPPNSLPASHRLLGRIDTDTAHAVELHSGLQQHEMMSPLSASEGPMSARSPGMDSSSGGARREPSLVVIACRQCRARKIRCDSTRPSCNNCVRRQNDCQYDAVPKRRGPDKRPGTRQRSCKKRPADGSMPVKKKQKKGASAESPDVASPQSSTVKSESADRDAEDIISGGGGGLGSLGHPPHHHHSSTSPLTTNARGDFGNGGGGGGDVSGGNAKTNMNLRLDMNFMDRPQSAYGSGQLSSSHSHSRTHSTQSSQSHHMPSGSVSPTTSMSLHTFSALSPELRFPKSSFRGGPFAKYEQTSAESLSDSELNDRSFSRQLNLSINTLSPPSHVYLSSPSDLNNNKLWWDTLLHEYSSSPDQSERAIIDDLTTLFNSSIHWLSFLNEKHFFRRLLDPSEREKMQPSLVLAALALSTLLQSSELGRGPRGRARALRLRDVAQSYLNASWNASSVDPALAQAAMLIAIFESSAHPQHSDQRACDSLILLDQIIRTLALTAIDLADPNACVFSPDAVPSVPRPAVHDITLEERCYCAPPIHSPHLDLGHGGRLSPTWSTSISWDPTWSIEEIEREQTRRLCWAALSLAADQAVHSTALHQDALDLFVSRPENYALLFPGEKSASADEGQGPYVSPKQSIWALYCRSMLLWNSCLHMRKIASDSDKAEFSVNAWLEASDIEDALDAHHCSTESHLMFMTREHVFNTRISVSYEFRRLQSVDSGILPKFNRRQAEEWISYQTQTANRFKSILQNGRDPLAQVLARRPFYVWWFMSQLAISMSLWVYDNTLVNALDLAKAFITPLDILSALWPCAAQREQYLVLWKELIDHCNKAAIPPPPQPDFTLRLSFNG